MELIYIEEYSTKCLFSRHIPKSKLGIEDTELLTSDIKNFNQIKRTAYSYIVNQKNTPEKGMSLHVFLKKEFQVSDYFVNSAENEAKAAEKSRKELVELHIEEKEARIDEMNKKLTENASTLAKLIKCKESLVKRSKARKDGKKLPAFKPGNGTGIHMDAETGKVTVYNRLEFENEYLFEIQYLDKEIKKRKSIQTSIKNRIERTKREIQDIKEDKRKVCFGTKDLFHSQFTKPEIPHGEWKNTFRKAREHKMMISGRKDAKQGNFLFRYDALTHILSYTCTNGTTVRFQCEFPYGQNLVDQAVSLGKAERQAVTWSIEDCGSSFLVRCMVHVKKNTGKNLFFGEGCIGADVNADRISIAETDKYGNLIRHQDIPFHILRKSSGQIEHILSAALEKVFLVCKETKKPLVLEDISNVKKGMLYQGKRLNEVLSSFAYSKMRALAESKSEKYGVGICYVNPCYTSQIGKVKYMRRFGLAIHEAAAFVIARRGMGWKETVPDFLKKYVPAAKLKRHHWTHWASLHGQISKIKWRKGYKKFPESKQYPTLKEYVGAYMYSN